MNTPLRSGLCAVLFLLALVAGVVASAEPSAPLSLEAQVDGAWIKVLGREQKQLLGQAAAGRRVIPPTAALRLVGDLAAQPALVDAEIEFALTETPPPTDTDRATAWRAQNIHSAAEFVAGPKARWHPAQPEKAVVVCVWQVAGKPTQLRTIPLQSYRDDGFKAAWVTLELAPADASGNPLLLLLENGEFLPKQIDPPHAAANRLGILSALGQDAAVAAELRSGASLPATAKNSPTLLHLAAQAGAIQSVEALLQLGASPKTKTAAGDTPLHSAARNGRTAVVERLLAAKAPLGAANAALETPLHLAAAGAHAEASRLLVEAGAFVNATNGFNQTPAFCAFLADSAPTVELLLARKGDLAINDSIRDRLLVRKAASGQRRLVQILLARHANPNSAWFEQPALLAAAREGHEGVVAELLAAKADPNKPGVKGITPLIAAASRGRAPIVRQLLAAGASPTATSDGGYTPLHAASFAGSASAVQTLLAAAAPTEPLTTQGLTPLSFALGSGSRDTVELLLAAGAKTDPASQRFDAELTAALAMDSDAFLAAALKAGMPVDHHTAKGWPVLQLATIGKAERCASLLRNAGANETADAAVSALVPISQLEKRPALLELHPTIDPRDPEEGDFAGTTVVVEAVVGQDGAPAFARASCEDCRLSRSAVQTVLRSRFQPGLKDGTPVATKVRIPVVFNERPERTFEFQSLDVKPQALSRVPPRYPFELKRQGITGHAVVEFIVDENGDVHGVFVVDATHEGFAASAVAAVREWRFKPGVIDGKAVPTRMQQVFPFRLN